MYSRSLSQNKIKRVGNEALRIIPGVGPSLSKDLNDLGILSVSDLVGKNPETLYKNLERRRGVHIDRCVLYVFRCAIYFAERKNPDPEKLKWWN
jgi:hypothetical protein